MFTEIILADNSSFSLKTKPKRVSTSTVWKFKTYGWHETSCKSHKSDLVIALSHCGCPLTSLQYTIPNTHHTNIPNVERLHVRVHAFAIYYLSNFVLLQRRWWDWCLFNDRAYHHRLNGFITAAILLADKQVWIWIRETFSVRHSRAGVVHSFMCKKKKTLFILSRAET